MLKFKRKFRRLKVKEKVRSGKEIGDQGYKILPPDDILLETDFCNRNYIQVTDVESVVRYTDL